MSKHFRALARRQGGQSMVEYGVAIALVSAVAFGAFQTLGQKTNTQFATHPLNAIAGTPPTAMPASPIPPATPPSVAPADPTPPSAVPAQPSAAPAPPADPTPPSAAPAQPALVTH